MMIRASSIVGIGAERIFTLSAEIVDALLNHFVSRTLARCQEADCKYWADVLSVLRVIATSKLQLPLSFGVDGQVKVRYQTVLVARNGMHAGSACACSHRARKNRCVQRNNGNVYQLESISNG
jgi:CRISPR/Cas system type I-B associated protein Csh2 (Cas7 group RAMP superfamily)